MEECREKQIDFNRYIISENGDIISKFKNKPMSNKVSRFGYIQNTFRDINGNQMAFYRHRVVWFYFNGEIPQGKEIDHINGDKTDNSLENLRCVTPKENSNNPITIEYMKNKVWSDTNRNKKIANSNRGKIITEQQKEKQRIAMSGTNHPNYGKKRPEHSLKMKNKLRDKHGRWI